MLEDVGCQMGALNVMVGVGPSVEPLAGLVLIAQTERSCSSSSDCTPPHMLKRN